MMRLRSGLTSLVVLVLLALSIAGCGESQPQVISDIEAAATAIEGEGSVRSDHFVGPTEDFGWQVSVLTRNPDPVVEAITAVFDGRGYAIEQDGSKTTVAGSVFVDPGTPTGETYVLTVWVPTSALGKDGYPSN